MKYQEVYGRLDTRPDHLLLTILRMVLWEIDGLAQCTTTDGYGHWEVADVYGIAVQI